MSAAIEAAAPKTGVRQAAAEWWNGLRAGDVGNLPIILALIAIAIFFQAKNDHFDDPGNIVNLMVQMAGITTIGLGVVFVLLLGEIDLSVGYVSGVCGVIAAKLVEPAGTASSWPVHTSGLIAILVALIAGAAIGMVQGAIVVKIGIPSFVVTLAGYLGWAGVVLIVIGDGGTIPIQVSTSTGSPTTSSRTGRPRSSSRSACSGMSRRTPPGSSGAAAPGSSRDRSRCSSRRRWASLPSRGSSFTTPTSRGRSRAGCRSSR